MGRYPLFDRTQLRLRSLSHRGNLLEAAECSALAAPDPCSTHPGLAEVVSAILRAREHGKPVILMMGAHLIKLGLSRFIIDLLERDWITHVATNGAGIIHDYELALVGGTSECVARWVAAGQFGLWQETGTLNDVIRAAADAGEGLAEAVGRTIAEERYPHRDLSIAAAAWTRGIPMTAHVSIGSDIIHEHLNCDGAAVGQTSYQDFLVLARAVQDLEAGVFLNVGSAVVGPETYLKALSMARNVAALQGRRICDFTTAVFDLATLPENYRTDLPTTEDSDYYFRPWKTILVRTVSDGGSSHYVPGHFRQTIPALWAQLTGGSSLLRTAPFDR